MKSLLSGAVLATAIVACLSLNVQAKTVKTSATVAVSDTGKMKMSKDKMKMDKMDKKKMSKDKMKMDKMKMSKDSSKKM